MSNEFTYCEGCGHEVIRDEDGNCYFIDCPSNETEENENE